MTAPSTPFPVPALDHIVILLPHHTLQNLPSWLTDAFTLSPGGRHADNVTKNKLILFQDGVYLELISFIPGQEHGRASHRWGSRMEGHIIDWAYTLPGEQDLEVVRERIKAARTGIAYATPQPGGRVRPDGVELKWVTCSPELPSWTGHMQTHGHPPGFVGGEAPFWCLDRTPREWRVPCHMQTNVRHPSGALGLGGVSVYVRDGALFQTLKGTYDALQGREGHKLEAGNDGGRTEREGFSWSLQVPASTGQLGPDYKDETTGRQQRTLRLIKMGQEEEGYDYDARRREVSVDISLFTSERSAEKIGGTLGDEGWVVKFDLVGPSGADN